MSSNWPKFSILKNKSRRLIDRAEAVKLFDEKTVFWLETKQVVGSTHDDSHLSLYTLQDNLRDCAPDLLAACKAAYAAIEGENDYQAWEHTMNILQSAIRKAQGN